jgi:hypothetical protein
MAKRSMSQWLISNRPKQVKYEQFVCQLVCVRQPPCSQVGAVHPLYLYSEMRDMSLRTLSCGMRASDPISQES